MKKLIGLIAVVCLTAGMAVAQIVSKVEDKSVAFRVKNGYSSGTLTIVIADAGSTITGVVNALPFTITVLGANTNGTITLLAASVGALTNAAGTKSLTVDSDSSLAADSTDAELLNGTYTATPGNWLEVLWDTSACKFYSLYFPDSEAVRGTSKYKIARVLGQPGGTGNLTLFVYKVGVLVAQQVITSPVYVNPATWIDNGTNGATNTFGVVDIVNLDHPLNLSFSGSEPIIVRAARATTATTGVLSAILE